MRAPKLAFLVLLLLWAGSPIPAQDPPAEEPPVAPPPPAVAPPLDTFVPTEKLPADAEVAFPVDI